MCFGFRVLSMKISVYYKIALVGILLTVIYYPAFVWMWGRWMQTESYYSHGPLIIIASLFFLWNKRDTLKKPEVSSSDSGIILIVIGLLLHLVGIWIKFYFASALSMIILLFGLVSYLFGKKVLKEVYFAIIYLLFMIPLPLVLESSLVINMKLFATQLAACFLTKIGITAVRDGSTIKMLHSYLEVEAPCSGLRSLIALLAFGAAFSYLTRHNLIKKWILFLSALPIAIGANMLRIVLLGWVSDVYGMEAARGWIHDFSGYLLFAVAAIGMLGVNSLISTQNKHEILNTKPFIKL